MDYKHGIEVEELQTPVTAPLTGTSGVQVVFGITPIHLAKNPDKAVNIPVKINTFEEAAEILGYSDDWDTYPACASMYMAFKVYNISPVIFVNVLDPQKHVQENESKEVVVNNLQAVYEEKNVLLNSVVIKKEEEILKENEDYVISNEKGYPVVHFLSEGKAAAVEKVNISSKSTTPETVTETDIIGGYNAETGKETGLECLRQVYVLYQLVPGIILAPGWSHKAEVAAVMQAKTIQVNEVFHTFAAIDVDTEIAKVYTNVQKVKDENGINSENAVALWPLLSVNGKKAYYSAVWSAMAAYTDAQYGDKPYKSPSNELLNVSGALLADGTEVYMDTSQAATLNGAGIVTAINDGGWRSWGNNTAAYPKNTDSKDRWITSRRMMNWYEAHFITQYKNRVDSPYNARLVESLIDSENLYLNGLTSAGYIAGGTISYNEEENTKEDILNGHVTFRTRIAFWIPTEYILNKIVFDPDILAQALSGAGGE